MLSVSKPIQNAAHFLRRFTNVYDLCPNQEFVDLALQFMVDGTSSTDELSEIPMLLESLLVFRELSAANFWKLLRMDEYEARTYVPKRGEPFTAVSTPFEENVYVPAKYINSTLPSQEATRRDILADFGRLLGMKTDDSLFSLMTFNEPVSVVAGCDIAPGDIHTAISYLRDKGHNPDLMVLTPFGLALLTNDESSFKEWKQGTLMGCAVAWTASTVLKTIGGYRALVLDSEAFGVILMGKKFSLKKITETDYRVSGSLQFVGNDLSASALIQVNNEKAG